MSVCLYVRYLLLDPWMDFYHIWGYWNWIELLGFRWCDNGHFCLPELMRAVDCSAYCCLGHHSRVYTDVYTSFWARPPQRWWLLALSLHECCGIHAHVLLTALVHGLHVTNTAVGSFYCPVSLQAQWTSVYCLIRRTAWPWVRIHWFAQSGDRTPVSGTASSVSA